MLDITWPWCIDKINEASPSPSPHQENLIREVTWSFTALPCTMNPSSGLVAHHRYAGQGTESGRYCRYWQAEEDWQLGSYTSSTFPATSKIKWDHQNVSLDKVMGWGRSKASLTELLIPLRPRTQGASFSSSIRTLEQPRAPLREPKQRFLQRLSYYKKDKTDHSEAAKPFAYCHIHYPPSSSE